jgi:hypothetical protein
MASDQLVPIIRDLIGRLPLARLLRIVFKPGGVRDADRVPQPADHARREDEQEPDGDELDDGKVKGHGRGA